jgi:YVTN family beta-propeller protein
VNLAGSGSSPFSVVDTLGLCNNSLSQGVSQADCGDWGPDAAAYDSGTNQVFVSEGSSNRVSAVSDSTNRIVATINVGSYPDAIVYDSVKGELFVANDGSGNVSVISDATDKVVATIPVSGYPDAVAYDSGKGQIFVANEGLTSAGYVSVISDSSNAVVTNIPEGGAYGEPNGVAYDPANGKVFVSNSNALTLGVISDKTDKLLANVTLGLVQGGITFDSGKGEVFITDRNLGQVNVTVISAASNKVVATVPVAGYPLGIAYDPGKGEVFVTNDAANKVSVISDASNTEVGVINVGYDPVGLAYDGSKGELFITNAYSASLSVVSDSSDKVVAAALTGGVGPIAVAYDSGKGEVFVANQGAGNVSVISDTTQKVTTTIPVGEAPGAVVYDSVKGEVFVANGLSDNVSVISDSTNRVITSIPVGSPADWPGSIAYDSGKGEVFLLDWFGGIVYVISDTTNAVVATVSLGFTLPAGIAYDSAKGELFVANEYSNTVSVISDSTDSVVASISVGVSPLAIAYDHAKNELFVSNYSLVNGTGNGPGDVDIISDSSYAILATVPVGFDPAAIAYDSGDNQVLVSNYGSAGSLGFVNGISDTTDKVVSNTTVGSGPAGLVYDSGSGLNYVADSQQSAVSMFGMESPQIISDTFSSDSNELNTSIWRVNSPELNSTVSADNTTWSTVNQALYPPNFLDFDASRLSVSSSGLGINVSGVGLWTGISSNYVFTPPYSLKVVAKPTSIVGGNPIVVCLDNQTAGAMLCVFVSNQVWVQVGNTDPISIGGVINSGDTYSIFVNATATTASVAVTGPSLRTTWSGAVSFSKGAAQFVTLATFAGNAPGESSRSTYTDHALFKSVSLSSDSHWNLKVTTKDQPLGGTATLATYQEVYLTDVVDNRIVAALNSGSTGVVTFTGLPSGLYEATAVASAFNFANPVVGMISVVVGSPDNPTRSTVDTNLTLLVPPISPLKAHLEWSPPDATVWKGATLNFTATPSGGTFNCTYKWFVGGVLQTSATLPYLIYSAATAGTIGVRVEVSCVGTWFGQTCAKWANASGQVNVTNTHYEGSLTVVSGSADIAVADDGGSDQTGIYIDHSKGSVSIVANLSLDLVGGITIPPVISSLLGISTPYYVLSVGDAAGTVLTNTVFQLASPSTYPTTVTLYTGTPYTVTGSGSLLGYDVNYSLSPRGEFALALDAVTAILAVLGLKDLVSVADFDTYVGALVNYLLSFDVNLLQSLISDPLGTMTQLWENVWPQVLNFLVGLAGTLGLTAFQEALGKDLSGWWIASDILFDLGAIFGAVVGGTVTEEYQISGLTSV